MVTHLCICEFVIINVHTCLCWFDINLRKNPKEKGNDRTGNFTICTTKSYRELV